jgi:hypothetical protein
VVDAAVARSPVPSIEVNAATVTQRTHKTTFRSLRADSGDDSDIDVVPPWPTATPAIAILTRDAENA